MDSDLLAYLNLHRDRIAREGFRWIVFLHEADAEQFQREAGDLWDVRQHTFWLDGEPVPREERLWMKVDRNLETSGRHEIEAGREEIEAHCRSVRELVERTGRSEDRARLLGDLAGWLLRRGAAEAAVPVAREALGLLGEGWSEERAELEAVLAHALRDARQPGQAVRALERRMRNLRELGKRREEGRTLLALSETLQEEDRFEEAEEALESALRILEEEGDEQGLAWVFEGLGFLAMRRNYQEAEERYTEAARRYEELGDRSGLARSYYLLGIASELWGSSEDALDWYRASLVIWEELGDRSGVARSYHQLGVVSQSLGSYEDALDWYRKSLEIWEELGDRAGVAASYDQLGRVAELRGSHEDALDWYRKSLEIKEELGDRPGLAATIGQIGALLTKTGRAEEAVPLNLRSLDIRLRFGLPQVGIDLRWLHRQRTLLGDDAFRALLDEHLDAEDRATVLQLMADPAAAPDAAPDDDAPD